MVTIVLAASRIDYLTKVITNLELLECNAEDTNILCIVDGDNQLYIRARNLIAGTKFRERLTIKSVNEGLPSKLDISQRRRRIAAVHNQAKKLIAHTDGYVLSVEDDTLIPPNALNELLKVAISNRAFAMAEGVELGRWGVPYVGAWIADDIYDVKQLTSVKNINPVLEDVKPTNIDAGGLYCALIRTDLYKQHEFYSSNGLGPDVNFGIENRQLGFENFIVWQVPCVHLYQDAGLEKRLSPSEISKIITLTKKNDIKWTSSY